jgi:protein SCO1/2
VSRRALHSAGAVLAAAAACTPATKDGPPRFGRLPEFSLQDHFGHPVTLARLAGKTWVADFIFTRCAGACPAMTARMARLRREVPEEVAFVSFTVDPGHDTPEVLARHASAFTAGQGWLFVTGPQKDLYALSTGGFKLAAMEVPPDAHEAGGDGPFLHSSKFVLVDRGGEIRGYYDSTDEDEVKKLQADIGRLQNGRRS